MNLKLVPKLSNYAFGSIMNSSTHRSLFGESTKAIQAVVLTSVCLCLRRKRRTMWLERIPFKWQHRRRSTGDRTARVREWASAGRGVPMVAHSTLGIQHSARWPHTSLHLSLILFFFLFFCKIANLAATTGTTHFSGPSHHHHGPHSGASLAGAPPSHANLPGPHHFSPLCPCIYCQGAGGQGAASLMHSSDASAAAAAAAAAAAIMDPSSYSAYHAHPYYR